MARNYRTLAEADLQGKRVLLRAGFDVPIEEGKVTDVTRIESLMPTMKYILDKGATLILMAHQGRPKGGPDPVFSQKPLVPVLMDLLKTTVHFADDCVGPNAEKAVAGAKNGEVVLLENLRFHDEEKKNNPEFAKSLAKLADLYVNDAFTNCHRDHASMVGVPTLLPAYMGLLLENEVKHLAPVLDAPTRPLALIISGAKMETKVPVIRRFLDIGDDVLLGGCIANTFIFSQGNAIGASKCEKEHVPTATELLSQSGKPGKATVHVPTDVVIASGPTDDAKASTVASTAVPADMMILDIGNASIARYVEKLANAKTIIWNGPMGLSEIEQFSHATRDLVKVIAEATKRGATTIIGGGDTIDFHTRYGYPLSAYTFVSMGGGAMLEFLSGKEFQSLKVLEK